MRRSFGPMGGGGPGMMKTVHRAVRATSGGCGSTTTSTNSPTSRPTYKPSSSNSNTTNNNNFKSISISSNNHPNEYDDFVFSTVPSIDEVHHAVSSLQQVHDSGWDLDWIEPSTSLMQSSGSQSVYDAFRLLQTEPSVKKMVISLASDKSVWEAIMNNEAVRELRDSVDEGRSEKVESSEDLIISYVIRWIMINMKTKVMEVFENITETVNRLLFQSSSEYKKNAKGDGATNEVAAGPFEKKLRSSFLLTVMTILIIVVSRASRS
ncbi:uncharacterized protein [Rutidosis leptorrhynchoides]|uniref:uncharacterized protein isoform X2 n=1 Tax=Rutidosis leptorrhynchoides TaxID=125765 RepID=UPI003A9A4D62